MYAPLPRIVAQRASWAAPWPGADATTPRLFVRASARADSEAPAGGAAWTSGAPKRSVTRPPAARSTASVAHVSQSDVLKCMS